MPKHHHQSKAEQVYNREHGSAPFHYEKRPYPRSESMQAEDVLKSEVRHHSSIQLLAYQIYQEKGGVAFDNWLEAERILKNSQPK